MSESKLTPEWCMEAFWRVNPGGNAVVPSLYLLDFAREVLRVHAPSAEVEPIGYAVRMVDGPFVGIWRERETADHVCSKQPAAHGDYVLPVYALPSATARKSQTP